jgi:hypothetical protein
LHVQTDNLAWLAFRENFKWPAAHFAVGGESLRLDAGVDHQFEALTTEWALNGLGDLHQRPAQCVQFARGFKPSIFDLP